MNIFSRKTPINQAVLKLLDRVSEPVTEVYLRQKLRGLGIVAHKTTLYRQLEKLAAADKLEVSRFSDGITRYERKKAHHHHVICRSCSRVQDVEVGAHLEHAEQRIAKHVGFRQITHVLEFYGICTRCLTSSSSASHV